MLIHLQPSKGDLKNRLIYLLKGVESSPRPPDRVEVLYGDVATFSLIHKSHSREVKYFNLLITFKESKRELEQKLTRHGKTLKELHDEILSYLLPYDLEELNLLTVAHFDTGHYHWHITVDNQNLKTGKALYLPKTKLTIRLYDRLRRYISAKYGISLGIQQPYSVEVGTKKLIEKLKEKRKEGTTLKKEQVKRLITEQIKALILSGDINSRKDIEDYVERVLGLEINRRGKSYISIRYGNAKIRLSGGIYDESRFRQIAEAIRGGEEKDLYEPPERAGELEKELRELVIKHRDLIRKRLLPHKRETQPDRQSDRGQVRQSRERSPTGTQGAHRGEEISLAGHHTETNSGAGEGALLSSGNQAGVQTHDESLEVDSPDDSPDWFYPGNNWGSNSREETWRSNRAERISREAGRSRKAGKELQDSKTGVGKEVEDKNDSKQQRGGYSLFRIANDDGEDKGRESTLVCSDGERQSRKILHSVRPPAPTPYRTLIQKLYSEAVVDWELRRRVELETIKRIPPEVIFQDLGIEARKVGHRLNIYAPWREETEPSVFIEQKPYGHWVWKDFGNDKGGTWIDFFMELYGWDYVEAVKYLRERYLGADVELLSEVKRSADNILSFGGRKYELLELKEREIKHPALKRYLKDRGITKIPSWLREVHYKLKDKKTGEVKRYFALGVQTISGSWILRNPLIKMNLKPSHDREHSFAYISRKGNKRLVVVEGLFDALSVHQFARRDDFDLIILSGTGNLKKFVREGIYQRYDEIILALDFDDAGREAEKKLLEALRDFVSRTSRVITVKKITGRGKDINEAFLKRSLELVDLTEEIKPSQEDRDWDGPLL